MSELFPIASHFFDSNLTGINLDLNLFDVIHYNLTFTHLHEDCLHFDGFEVSLNKSIHKASVSRCTKDTKLGSLIHLENIIW